MEELLENIDTAIQMLDDIRTHIEDEQQVQADLEAIILHIKYTKERLKEWKQL